MMPSYTHHRQNKVHADPADDVEHNKLGVSVFRSQDKSVAKYGHHDLIVATDPHYSINAGTVSSEHPPGHGMDLSSEQREALDCVQAILDEAGLSPRNLESTPSPPPSLSLTSTPSTPLSVPLPAILRSQYIPIPACAFTAKEIARSLHRVNRHCHSDVHRVVHHPLSTVVEYPEIGSVPNDSIVHIFTVNPNKFDPPKASFQYSLGDSHGGCPRTICGLLHDQSDQCVMCKKLTTSCMSPYSFSSSLTQKIAGKGLKVCSEHDPNILNITHSFVSCIGIQMQTAPSLSSTIDNASRVVFDKTLTLFSVLHEQGCSFRVSDKASQESDHLLDATSLDSDSDLDGHSDSASDIGSDMDNLSMDNEENSHFGPHANFDRILQHFKTSWHGCLPHAVCKGRVILKQDCFNHHFIQHVVSFLLSSSFDLGLFCRCEHRMRHDQSHLVIRNLQEYNINYLRALLENDEAEIYSFELKAERKGYGPCLRYSFLTFPSAQKNGLPYVFIPTICSSINHFYSISTLSS